MWSHNKRAHSTDRPYTCRFGCSSTFKEPSDRSGHESKKHGMSYKSYQEQLLQQTTDAAATVQAEDAATMQAVETHFQVTVQQQ